MPDQFRKVNGDKMVEFQKVEKVPATQRGFKPSAETLEMTAIISGLGPGEVVHFVMPTEGEEAALKRLLAVKTRRAMTACKHVKEGYFRVSQRQGQVFVQRTE